MINDPTHLFRRMWAAEAWGTMEGGRPACWNVQREGWELHKQPSSRFFDAVDSGSICNTNWYEGNNGRLGMAGSGGGPRFPRHPGGPRTTPALLGFDESIDAHCNNHAPQGSNTNGHAERCVAANRNILSLYGQRLPYNICRNLEWQVCAAQGRLPSQGGRTIVFAIAPGTLDPSGATGKPLGQCKGWVPGQRPAGGVYGYATDDIFYLELCLLNQICRNGERIFNLRAGEEFTCDYSSARFRDLQRLLLTPAAPPPPQAKRCYHAELAEQHEEETIAADGLPSCSTCWKASNGPGDCSMLQGCDHGRCSFCTNEPRG